MCRGIEAGWFKETVENTNISLGKYNNAPYKGETFLNDPKKRWIGLQPSLHVLDQFPIYSSMCQTHHRLHLVISHFHISHVSWTLSQVKFDLVRNSDYELVCRPNVSPVVQVKNTIKQRWLIMKSGWRGKAYLYLYAVRRMRRPLWYAFRNHVLTMCWSIYYVRKLKRY